MKRKNRTAILLSFLTLLLGAGLWAWGKDLPVFSQASGPGPTNFGSKDSEMPSDRFTAYQITFIARKNLQINSIA